MNWDYIAGFFDGEGNIYAKRVEKSSSRHKNRFKITMGQRADRREVLLEIKRFLEARGIPCTFYTYMHKESRFKPSGHEMAILSIEWRDAVCCFCRKVKNKVIVKRNDVLNALEFAKKVMKRSRRIFTNEQLEEIKNEYLSGKSGCEIARKLRIPWWVVYNRLEKLGIKRRERAWSMVRLNTRYTTDQKTKRCAICGKEFLSFPSENKRFCSNSCRGIWLRKGSEAFERPLEAYSL